MKNKKLTYNFEKDLAIRLKDKEFKKEWAKSEPEYLLAKNLVEARVGKKMSQRDLAKKVKTSQAAISRIETGIGNPSLSFLKRLALALGGQLRVQLG